MFSDTFQVRFYETDALAHVSNTVLVGWFESGREPIFKIFNPELNLQKWPLILASYQVDFLRQIFYGQAVEIRTFVGRVGSSSFDVYQECWQNKLLCAKGTTTLVNFDYKTSKSVAFNQVMRAKLSEHMVGDG